jgi:hypothetical protein
MSHINALVAASNLVGLLPIVAGWQRGPLDGLCMALVVLASAMMHLSETKHGLPGLLWPQHSLLFLNIDRATAILGSIYALRLFLMRPMHAVPAIAAVGLAFMFLSENSTTSQNWFAFWHSSWHAIAYGLLWYLITNAPVGAK